MMPDEAAKAVEKIRTDLSWRSQNGKTMGHVLIGRQEAQELLRWIDQLRSQEQAKVKT